MSKEILYQLQSIYGVKQADSPSPRNIEAHLTGDFYFLEPLHTPDDEVKSSKILAEDEIELIEEGRKIKK